MLLSSSYAQEIELDSVVSAASQTSAEHGSNFPPFDASFFGSHLFWLALSFAVFYCLMARIIMPRIGSVIEGRRERISSDLARASALKEEADAAVLLYEQQLSQARAQAQMLARNALDEAKTLSDQEKSAAEISLMQRLDQAERKITALQTQAMDHVDQIAMETVEAILRSITNRKVDKMSLGKALKIAAQN